MVVCFPASESIIKVTDIRTKTPGMQYMIGVTKSVVSIRSICGVLLSRLRAFQLMLPIYDSLMISFIFQFGGMMKGVQNCSASKDHGKVKMLVNERKAENGKCGRPAADKGLFSRVTKQSIAVQPEGCIPAVKIPTSRKSV